MPANPRQLVGVGLVVVSAVSFGFMALFRSWAFEAGATTPMLLFFRFLIGAAVLGAFVALRRLPMPRGRLLLGLLAMGAVGYFGESMAYFTALEYIPAGLVGLLLYLYPAIVTLLAWTVLKERPGGRRLGAVALAMLGSALTIAGSGANGAPAGRHDIPVAAAAPAAAAPGFALGVGLGVAAACFYALYIVAGSRLAPRAGAVQSATVVAAAAAAVFGGVALAEGGPLPVAPVAWAGIGALAIVSTVIGVLAFLAGLERIGAVRASTLSALEPAVTVGVGVALLGEHLAAIQVAGGVLILAAAVITARSAGPGQPGEAGGLAH